ncbi:distal tail protein Dit, partial [Ornithinibacillus sp. JPR2-1]|uniref:distal tail protein Dit n=1 Tax=Ornithinibacillus sp. JPR2-1 TaxID=2094019 RepID=UPI0031D2BDFE
MGQSLTFRGLRKDYLMVTHRRRTYWAPRNLVLTEKRKTGSKLRRVKRGVRVEEVSVEVSADSTSELRKHAEDLSSWLLTENVEELIFDDERDRRYMAIVDGSFNPDEIVTHGYGMIRFIIPESAKRGQTKQQPITTEVTSHVITGQTETPWKVRVNFTVPQSRFTLESSNGLYILLNYNFIAGDMLEIDYVGRKVYLNGNDLRS